MQFIERIDVRLRRRDQNVGIRAEAVDDLDAIGSRDHTLVLEEPTLAVEAVPVVNGIERVEEGVVMLVYADLWTELSRIIRDVKRFYAPGCRRLLT